MLKKAIDMYDAALFVSSVLLIPVLCFCAAVVIKFKASACKAIRERPKAEQWLILGVFISFLFEALDNLYWGFAWSMAYARPGYMITQLLFENGVYPNIPFRLMATIAAGYCHCRAAAIYCATSRTSLHGKIALSLIAGLGYALLLVAIQV